MNITVVGNRPVRKFAVLGFQSPVFSDIGGETPSDRRSNSAVRADNVNVPLFTSMEPPSAESFSSLLASSPKEPSGIALTALPTRTSSLPPSIVTLSVWESIFESDTNIDRIGIRIIGLGTNDQTFDRLRSISVFVRTLIRKHALCRVVVLSTIPGFLTTSRPSFSRSLAVVTVEGASSSDRGS